MFNIRFVKFTPGEYALRYRKGKLVSEGAGIAFFCNTRKTSIVVVPIASADVPFIFEEVTSDYQTVTIQGEMTYRIADFKKITSVLDYTYNIKNKSAANDNAKLIAQRLINIARVLIKKHVERMGIRDAIRASESLANLVTDELFESREVNALGIEIIGFNVLAVTPNKDTSRALEAQAREEILRKADDALYERRNASIEQERKVKENELNTEIAIEAKKKQIQEAKQDTEIAAELKKKQIQEAKQDTEIAAEVKKQQIQEAKLEARRQSMLKENRIKEENLLSEIALEQKSRELVALSVENAKARADAKAYELSGTMNAFVSAFENINPAVLNALALMDIQPNRMIAMALREFAGGVDKIGQLNIAPDLLTSLMKEINNEPK